MTNTRALVAVALFVLTACGGDDEGDNTEPPVQTDQRKNVTGTYAVTGTLKMVFNGEPSVSPVQDTLRITNDTASASKSALRLHIESLACGPKASMTGEKTFSANETQCPLPSQNDCTASMTYTRGTGRKEANGGIQASLFGKIIVKCGTSSVPVDVEMVMSGPPKGQSVPGTREDALTAEAPDTLSTVLERLRLDARN